MSKDQARWETIEGLLREGWRFRVKSSKGKKYISARKSGEERGIGPFKQDLWDAITDWKPRGTSEEEFESMSEESSAYIVTQRPGLSEQPVEAKFTKRELEKALFDIRFERARVKARDCQYSFNGYCNYWKFIEKSGRLEAIYERFGAEHPNLPIISTNPQWKSETRDIYRVNDILCIDCDKFTLREKKQEPSPTTKKT